VGLDLLSQLAKKSRSKTRWACLADMLELGPDEERFHREIAPKIAQLGIERVLLLGPRMKWLENELANKGLADRVKHFETHAEMANTLTADLKAGDSLMLKGSRGMKMEEAWKLLEASVAERNGPTGKSAK
jgi:UDP-N-acetylmuramoyl-tripeptide--D-alanyl-D-alanine ligase